MLLLIGNIASALNYKLRFNRTFIAQRLHVLLAPVLVRLLSQGCADDRQTSALTWTTLLSLSSAPPLVDIEMAPTFQDVKDTQQSCHEW